jgi:hypothetical protein
MNQATFEREHILQELLAYYPDLIPGDQIDPEKPRRWLLVSLEICVPGAAIPLVATCRDHHGMSFGTRRCAAILRVQYASTS